VHLSKIAKVSLFAVAALALSFIYLPLFVVVVNSFSTSLSMSWPVPGLTLEWWGRAFASEGAMESVGTSLIVAAASTVIALVLGTLLSFALHRFSFFGKSAINLLVVLPIALPGIVTGLALNNVFKTVLDWQLGWATLIIAHATFCVVVVFNNVLARLKRHGSSLEEASSDLGAGVWTTFRLVTFPRIRSALVAGGILSFALSFDEIIVTTFTTGGGVTTLPIFILDNMYRPNQAPIVAVIAVVMTVLSVVPIYLAERLSAKDDR
jgi:putative spermidine/putrescine transport system permease protein